MVRGFIALLSVASRSWQDEPTTQIFILTCTSAEQGCLNLDRCSDCRIKPKVRTLSSRHHSLTAETHGLARAAMAISITGISALRYKIMKSVEKCVHDYVQAAKNHDYDIDSPLWSSLAPDFKADPNIGDRSKELRTKAEFLQSRAQIHKENPSYSLDILEITTTLNDKCDQAQVFVKYEAKGVPEGIVQQVAGKLDFMPVEVSNQERVWKCVRFASFRGLTEPVVNPFD